MKPIGRSDSRMGARLGRSIAIGIALAALAVAWRYSHIHSVQAAPGQSAASDPVFTNALIHSTSPYLLEHAHNPVNWYPWGPEALNLAVQQKKPIFLSIGYLACHWCHVMMREDFENPEIAKILNDGFVCIKVDREQRPDLDDQYITAVQMMTGSGGWPLSVFLLPDRKPFFGGTYFPPEEFKPLLLKILDLYAKQPAALQSQADRVAAALAASAAPRAGGRLAGDILQQAVSDLKARYDPREGGFAVRPKFPEAPDLAFLLAQYRAAHDSQCLQMVTHTLDRMAAGGIYDQLGGGFHRYSTDEIWRVPHFEKMLYDQALLVPIYLDAYQITKKPRYRQVAEETLGFVEREMRDPGGGFYSSLDADSEGEEGKYYLWTPAQVAQVLGRDAPIFDELYGVTNEGDLDGKSVLHLAEAPAAVARAHHLSEAQLTLLAAALRQRMLSARARRVRPATDDKILASWNGLMMAAFARAYSVLGNPHYLADAVNDARFINTGMNRNGGLFHSWRRGAVEVPGMLEDYASVAYGLEAIYDATHQKTWLEDAVQVAGQLAPRFEDKQNGGFFSTGDQGDLLGRRKEADDTVMPSGNSLAALALARLSSWTGDAIWRQTAARTIEAFQPVVSRSPGAFPALLMAYREAGFNQPAFTGAQASIVTATVTPDHATVRAGAQVPVTITVSVRDGWHINAHRISLPYLIPTDIRIPGSAAEKSYWDYPSGDPLKLSYAAKPLLVYQGRISIRGRVAIQKNAPAGSSRLHLVLHYQPCTDRACQAPAEIALEMGITVVR